MIRFYQYIFLGCLALVLSGCASYPMGWSQSCTMPFGSYTNEDGVISMTLDGDETDSCHRGKALEKQKQRSEIKHPVDLGVLYDFEFEFKYVGAGGATIMQLHPGKAPVTKQGIFNQCDQLAVAAGYNKVRLNIQGMAELYALTDDNYKDKWHKVVFRFRASNDDPLYQFNIDQKPVFDSEEYGGRSNLCYYKTKPNLKLGLYRGRHDTTETVYYRNLKLTRLE